MTTTGEMSMSLASNLPPPRPPAPPPPPPPVLPVSHASGRQGGPLKEITDRHPLFVAIGILLAGTAIGALPLVWLRGKAEADLAREQVRVEELQTRLASVTRTVGDVETSEIQLNKMIVKDSEVRTLPTSLDYHRDGDLYVSAPRQWIYEGLTEAQFSDSITAGSGGDLPAAAAEQPIYVWRDQQEIPVSYDDGSVDKFFSYVSVERISTDELIKIWSESAGDDEEMVKWGEALVRKDPLGAFFQFQIADGLSTNSAQAVTVLGDIQRTDLGLYARVTDVYTDVLVNGVHVDHLYDEQEDILLSTNDGFVLVQTSLPSLDRRSDAVVDSAEILESLRIVD